MTTTMMQGTSNSRRTGDIVDASSNGTMSVGLERPVADRECADVV
jgi:hypothetical protein